MLKTEDVIHTHTHNGILFNDKKERNFAICSNMDGLGGHYANNNKSEKCQTEKDKYCMISLICGI